MCNFVIWLVSHLSRVMLCLHFYEFGMKVRLRRSNGHGYQWFVRKRNLARTESTITPYHGDVVFQFQTTWFQHLRSVSLKFRPLHVHISECMHLIAMGAFHLSELTGQTIPVVTRISLLITTIQPDQSKPKC